MKTYSTVQVAKLLGVTPDTLHRWIRQKKVKAPEIEHVGGVQVRLWSDEEVERVRKYKADHYWGLGGSKPRKKETE
jgi:excisionase family DNA binding protein